MPVVNICSCTHPKNNRIFIDKKHFQSLIKDFTEQIVDLDDNYLEGVPVAKQLNLVLSEVEGEWYARFDQESHMTDLDFGKGEYVWNNWKDLKTFFKVIAPYVSHGNHMIIEDNYDDPDQKVSFKNGRFELLKAQTFFDPEEEILQLLINRYGIDSTLRHIQNSILFKEAVGG
jgi:hypothetical protein